MAYTAGAAGLWAVWYLVGSGAGVLWTRRGLWVGAALAGGGLVGLWVPWALPAPLLPGLVLVALGWVDAALAARAGAGGARGGPGRPTRLFRWRPPGRSSRS